MAKKIYKVGGLFSGIGGIESGFSLKGKFDILWASDLDKYSARTYRKNYKHKFIEKDINELKGNELEEVDVLVGGFPCQAFSLAGYQKGFEDKRGEVFFQIIRIINELPSKPKVLLLENVKNLYTHDNKNTFRIIQDALEKIGYCVFSKILNTSQYTSIPHNRERTFIVCFLEGKDAFLDPSKPMSKEFQSLFPPKILNKTKHISAFLEKEEVDQRYYYRQDKYNYKELVKAITKQDTVYQWRRVYVRENKSGVCPTLTANMGTGGHNVPLIRDDYGIRKLTPRECFNLQGFPENFEFPEDVPNSQLYKQAGNSVTVEMIKKIAEIIYKVLSNSK
ncbi:DNA (cytosine-5-)-methyltransferase [Hyphomicrobiales bacterium]|jgi:DNA (cytosine-5)-methyltransferase 1|nr:DNA (cytosine-5-)-methyltransferase [Hyphomicrobiales bacterium]